MASKYPMLYIRDPKFPQEMLAYSLNTFEIYVGQVDLKTILDELDQLREEKHERENS